ncbi:MAG: Uma2 family endonuclease [Lachnospiraceae bacterium]|nr:Uma2 family endonuclease [Lachnospiraceae bacterium]
MGLAQEQIYTIEDIYELPEGKRAELIDGCIYDMAPHNLPHQKIVHFLDKTIGNYIDRKKGNCEVLPAPFGVFLNKDDRNYMEPDISVICDKDKLSEKGCHGAPDWIIEAVSPGSKRMDYLVKPVKYESAGVREYWIVDSKSNTVHCHNFENKTMETYSLADKIPVGIYEDFTIDFSTLEL